MYISANELHGLRLPVRDIIKFRKLFGDKTQVTYENALRLAREGFALRLYLEKKWLKSETFRRRRDLIVEATGLSYDECAAAAFTEICYECEDNNTNAR